MIEIEVDKMGSKSIAAFDHLWRQKCGRRPMPDLNSFSKTELCCYLPQLVVAKQRFGRSYCLFVGAHIVRAGQMDFSGFYLDELRFAGEPTTSWPDIHTQVGRQQSPIGGACDLLLEHGGQHRYFAAVYPCSADGRVVDFVLGIEDWYPAQKGGPIMTIDMGVPITPRRGAD